MTMSPAGRGYLRLGLVQYYLPIAPQALLVRIALVRPKRRRVHLGRRPISLSVLPATFRRRFCLPST